MAKSYLLQFGSGNPSSFTGLAPTLIVFKEIVGGVNVTAPGITEIPTSTGLYYFNYGASVPIAFVADGFTTGLSGSQRYVVGEIDPVDAVDQQLTQQGSTLVAIGNSLSVAGSSLSAISGLLGNTSSSFGTVNTDPTTIFGYLKRAQEVYEGDSLFTKAIGSWTVYDRALTATLMLKTLTDTQTTVTKV